MKLGLKIRIGGRGGAASYNWTGKYISSLSVVTASESEQLLTAILVGSGYDGVSFESSTDNVTFTVHGTSATGVYNATGLTHNTIYWWRARLYKDANFGDYTYIVLAITKEKGWLSGGVNTANAIAAYEPIHASSLATSYVNKANPGTYNANPAAPPTLNADGWVFDGNDYLDTGVVPSNSGAWSILVLVKGWTGTANEQFVGKYNNATNTYFIIYRSNTASAAYHGGVRTSTSRPDEGAYMINGNTYLVDHGAIGTMTAPAGTWDKSIFIGCYNNNGAPAGYYDGTIKLVYIWDAALSAAQLLRLKWNMNAIGFPYKERALEYRQIKFSTLICWTMATFTNDEVAAGNLNPNTFAPTGYDIGQWLDAIKSAKIKRAYLTVKHPDGFMLWKSAQAAPTYDPYTIERTTWYANNGQRDIVLDFVNGCRERGILPALYFSIEDYTHEIRTGTDETSDAAGYIAMIQAQLTELLTNYGDIDAIWFDSWLWSIGYEEIPFATIYNFVKGIQPSCVVIDNRGNAVMIPGTTDLKTFEANVAGNIPSNNDVPAEEVETIRVDNKWFFHQGLGELVTDFHTAANIKTWHDNAYTNFGCYNLGLSPNKAGVLPSAMVTILNELGALL